MPILTFPAPDGRKKYVVRRISNGQIISRNVHYANAVDDSAIVGLDPDLEYLAMDQDLKPDYDQRVYVLTTAEERNASTTPPTWHITYGTEKRPLTDIKASAANVEALRNKDHYTEQERDKLVVLGLGVLFRVLANQGLTAKEIALKQRIIAMAATFWKNDARLAAIFTALEGGQDPDLDAQWEPVS